MRQIWREKSDRKRCRNTHRKIGSGFEHNRDPVSIVSGCESGGLPPAGVARAPPCHASYRLPTQEAQTVEAHQDEIIFGCFFGSNFWSLFSPASGRNRTPLTAAAATWCLLVDSVDAGRNGQIRASYCGSSGRLGAVDSLDAPVDSLGERLLLRQPPHGACRSTRLTQVATAKFEPPTAVPAVDSERSTLLMHRSTPRISASYRGSCHTVRAGRLGRRRSQRPNSSFLPRFQRSTRIIPFRRIKTC